MNVRRADIERGLRELGLGTESHVLVHTSYKSLGGVEGGPKAVIDALLNTVATLMMPASTWEHTAVWDSRGRFEGNAYMEAAPLGATAEPFKQSTPIDRNIGIIPETLRTAYGVRRSTHPLQSFVVSGELAEELTNGDDTDFAAPIQRLMDAGGELLLMGVSHKSSTAIHLGEQLAGRQLFTRHALTNDGVRGVICGGCGNAFDGLQPHVQHLEQRSTVGEATLRRYQLRPYVEAARDLIKRDPHALLCACVRCDAHRNRVLA